MSKKEQANMQQEPPVIVDAGAGGTETAPIPAKIVREPGRFRWDFLAGLLATAILFFAMGEQHHRFRVSRQERLATVALDAEVAMLECKHEQEREDYKADRVLARAEKALRCLNGIKLEHETACLTLIRDSKPAPIVETPVPPVPTKKAPHEIIPPSKPVVAEKPPAAATVSSEPPAKPEAAPLAAPSTLTPTVVELPSPPSDGQPVDVEARRPVKKRTRPVPVRR